MTSPALLLSFVTLLGLSGPALPQDLQGEAQKLSGQAPESFDYFGRTVAIHGERIAVGAFGDAGGGSVQVFRRVQGTWTPESYLTAPGAWNLGWALDMDATRIAAGGQSRGVWIFVDGPSGWTLEGTVLPPPYVGTSDQFGSRTAIDGERLVLSATKADVHGIDSGLVELYRWNGSTWAFEQELLPLPAAPGRLLGAALDIQGDTVVLSSTTYRDGTGAVWVFRELTPGKWSRVQRIESPMATTSDEFGFGASLQLDGERLIVGEPGNHAGTRRGGAAHVFVRQGGLYVLEQSLFTGDETRHDNLGSRVALSGDRALVTATNRDVAYLWERDTSGWTNTKRLMRASMDGYFFGDGAALSGDIAAVGDTVDSSVVHQSGGVYVYHVDEPPVGVPFCFGDGSAGPCPCGNETPVAARAGCGNAGGYGATLLAAGSTSVAADNLVIGAALPDSHRPAMLLYSYGWQAALPAGDGLECLGVAPARTWYSSPQQTHWGPGLCGLYGFVAGDQITFQVFQRDAAGACMQGFNTSNALRVTMVP